MNYAKFTPAAISILILLSACGTPATPTAQPTIQVIPTNPPPTVTTIPSETNTPLPTETATLVPTETPVGQIFRDDFTGSLQPGWTWKDENPNRWTFTPDGWLQIMGEDPALIGHGYQSNLLCRDVPPGEFQVTIHLLTITTDNFQQTAMFIYQDADNFIGLNRGFCSFCGGNGIYMDYKLTKIPGTYKYLTTNNNLFLRLTNRGDTITGYYALEPDQWNRLGSVGNFIQNAKICIGVSNADWEGLNADLVGRFDFIDISQP